MPNDTTPNPTQSAKNGSPSAGTLVSVIIPSLHRPDLLQQCLASLAQQTLPAQQFEVIIIENDARSDCMLPTPLPENVHCIPLAENLGTTGSINRGLQQSSSEYVLLLNNDVEVDARFLEVLIAVLEVNPSFGFASGKLLNARRRNILDGAGDALLRGGGAYRLGHGNADLGQFEQVAPIIAGCGAATLYRRSVLEQIQGLDEDFFAYLDDIDLGLRTHLAGYTGVYTPQAVACHLGSATLGDAFHPRIAEFLTRNQLFLLVKDYPAGALCRLLGPIAIFQLLWLAMILRRGRLIAYLRGMIKALGHVPAMLAKRRRVMRSRRLSSAQFLALLRASERQILDWQTGLHVNAGSRLLSLYFRIFSPR